MESINGSDIIMKWVTYKGSFDQYNDIYDLPQLSGLKENKDFKRLPFFIEEEGFSQIILFIYEEKDIPEHIKKHLK